MPGGGAVVAVGGTDPVTGGAVVSPGRAEGAIVADGDAVDDVLVLTAGRGGVLPLLHALATSAASRIRIRA
jgi:hypothetical protein